MRDDGGVPLSGTGGGGLSAVSPDREGMVGMLGTLLRGLLETGMVCSWLGLWRLGDLLGGIGGPLAGGEDALSRPWEMTEALGVTTGWPGGGLVISGGLTSDICGSQRFDISVT